MSGETILIVDDGRDNREFIIEFVIQPNGFKALSAKDGVEGLQMALKHKPDLILLDVNMPRMDGTEVLRQLAARKADIPVVLMTFHGSEDLAIEVYRLGVKNYVKKPFFPEEMLEAINEALRETRLRKERDKLHRQVMAANKELQNRIKQLNVLFTIGKSVSSLMDMLKLMPRLVDAAIHVTKAEEGYMLLLEEDRLVCKARKHHQEQRARPADHGVKEPLAMRSIKSGEPTVMTPNEINRDIPDMPWSAVYAPIVINKDVIGVLCVKNVSHDSRPFDDGDATILSALTDYAAIAITNARNYETLRKRTDADKEQIIGTFERLVPPSVVDRAITKPESLKLGGSRREISVLFADIRGYSTWSEEEQPEHVVETLNNYLSLAAEIILGWEGTLDKFMGDGFMAIFNAPENQDDHVHRAADAALALMKAAQEVQSMHGHRLMYSVGVNVGEAVVGYIGADRAMNYTAIGDTVNLAKRLEEISAPGQILISNSVRERLGDLAQVSPLGEIRLKGRNRKEETFELTGLRYED